MGVVRKAVLAGLGVTVAAAGAAVAGTSDGQGAQRSGLVVTQPASNQSQCQKAGTGATNGFAILNAPGKTGSVSTINGEVSLKRGPANSVFRVYLTSDGNCTMFTTLRTNKVGNGNAHLRQPGSAGTYYVVLQDMMGNEQFASNPVVLR